RIRVAVLDMAEAPGDLCGGVAASCLRGRPSCPREGLWDAVRPGAGLLRGVVSAALPIPQGVQAAVELVRPHEAAPTALSRQCENRRKAKVSPFRVDTRQSAGECLP